MKRRGEYPEFEGKGPEWRTIQDLIQQAKRTKNPLAMKHGKAQMKEQFPEIWAKVYAPQEPKGLMVWVQKVRKALGGIVWFPSADTPDNENQ